MDLTLDEKLRDIKTMPLDEKLCNINKPKMKPLKTGENTTIKEFYDSFIEPLLPLKKTIEEWNDLLLRYVDDPDAVFVIRAFMGWSPASVEEIKDDELRRGFLTHSGTSKINYFFTDNYFAHFFAKMAIDNYCPEYDEFKDMMINRSFPARFGKSCRLEKDKAAYKIDYRPEPGISQANYKIAHIVDAGKHYTVDGKRDLSITELSEIYGFNRGKYSDWAKDSRGVFIRDKDLSPDSRKVLIAHFLRFVDPLNYVLVPKAKYKDNYYGVFYDFLTGERHYDIAEYKPLLDYIHNAFLEKYGKMYSCYLDRLLLNDDFFNSKVTGDEVIDIKYGIFSMKSSGVPASPASTDSKKEPELSTESKSSDIPAIHLKPSSEAEFKDAFLKSKKARITWIYKDGTKSIEEWNYKKLSPSSKIRGNIQSRPRWREKDDKLESVEVEVL